MTTRRKLSTGDSGDFEIPLDTPFDLGYAYNLASSSVTQVHSSKDSMRIRNLNEDQNSYVLLPKTPKPHAALIFNESQP